MSWQKRFTFRDKRYVEHEVPGLGELRFYPNRMALLTEVRDLSAPVAKAISVLFADESRDSGSAVKRTRDGKDFFVEDITTSAVSQEMAKYRQAERERAIDEIASTLSNKRSMMVLGKLWMDSLRDEFPYRMDRSPKEVEEFLYGEEDGDYSGLDAPSMISLFQGWMKANAKVFGEMGEKMVGLVRERLESELQLVSPSEPGTETEPTSGDASKSPTSSPSEQDSLQTS